MSYELLQAAARVKGLTPHERCVLVNLADRANHKTNACWPTVSRIVEDSGVSEREVHRALKRLREKGLIKVTGKTKYGVNVYSLTLMQQCCAPGVGCHTGSPEPVHSAPGHCHVDTAPLPLGHPNNTSKPTTEQKKFDLYTSAQLPALAQAQVKSTSNQSSKSSNHTDDFGKDAAGEPSVSGESKLVKAWKAAHAKAGLQCKVSAIDGKKLSLLTKGPNGMSYSDALNILIPEAIANWAALCTYMASKHGVSCWGKKPAPKWPHPGFLLKYRQIALQFCSMDPQQRAAAIYLYVKKPFLPKPGQEANWDTPEMNINDSCS